MILVDSNVVLDVLTGDPVWAEWSLGQLDAAFIAGRVGLSDIAFAELSVRYRKIEQLDNVLSDIGISFKRMPKEALFLAGRVFGQYRAAGGTRESILPDFLIGAHAAVLDVPLLTRDVRRYRTYFPTVGLIAP
jgi:predicted nucleic acid-binding protein